MIRQLRGLRAQLILWTILPLAAVLVFLSVAGVTRHRNAMTALVQDRNRGLALAEAGRLVREVDTRAEALLAEALDAGVIEFPSRIGSLAQSLEDEFAGGLVLLDAGGAVVTSSSGAAWGAAEETAVAATRAAATGRAAYETLMTGGDPVLIVAEPLSPDHVIAGGIPTGNMRLAESSSLVESGVGGAVVVVDATGRRLYLHNPTGLHIDANAVSELLAAPAESAGQLTLRSPEHELSVTYSRVDPPGWTLAIAEDVHSVGTMGFSVVEALPLALLAVALIALLAISFGVAQVVRPLQELDRRAQRVAWGDFDAVKQPVGGVQEMDDLRATLAQMAERIRSYQAGMRDYLTAVTQAQEAERERLAHELHDDTVQALIALRQRAQAARKSLGTDPQRAGERLDELTSLLDEELANLRRLIGDLRPIYLEDLGFVPALEMLGKQVQARHGLGVSLDVRGEVVRLAPDLELAAFRIVQQALANTAAHAQARAVAISITFQPRELALSVVDDGRGFTPPDQPADLARDGHFGLMGMRERALLYGGQLGIESAPGKGARITARLPTE